MSVLNKKPFIQSVLDDLDSHAVSALIGAMNGTGNITKVKLGSSAFIALKNVNHGISHVILNVDNLREVTGYLIYTDSHCVFIAYDNRSNHLTQTRIDSSFNMEVIKEDLTIEELRQVCGDRVADIEVEGGVPETRTIAGISLENDITKTELQQALDVDKVWESSINVYNKDTDTPSKYIDENGNLLDSTNFSTSDFIEIPFNGDNYMYINASNVAADYNDYKGIYWYGIYDENKTFINRSAMISARISGINNSTNHAKYIRIVVAKNTTDLMVTFKPTYDASYDPVYQKFGGDIAEPLKEAVEDIASSTYDTITENKEDTPLRHLIYNGGMMSIFRKIGVVGDSLSSGCMETHDHSGIDMYDYSWIQTIGRICGSTAFNFSAGGLTSKNFWTTNNTYVKHLRDKDNDYKCTGYFIALGVNDIADTNLNVGTADDINDDTKDTFYAYYSRIISLIKEVQPKAKIFLIGLPNHPAMTVWGSRFTAFKNAIADMVNYFDDCYYLDLFTYDVLYDDDFRAIYFNGFHENALGYLRSAWVISTYCDWIIRHYYEDFREVAFIGTNNHYYE